MSMKLCALKIKNVRIKNGTVSSSCSYLAFISRNHRDLKIEIDLNLTFQENTPKIWCNLQAFALSALYRNVLQTFDFKSPLKIFNF